MQVHACSCYSYIFIRVSYDVKFDEPIILSWFLNFLFLTLTMMMNHEMKIKSRKMTHTGGMCKFLHALVIHYSIPNGWVQDQSILSISKNHLNTYIYIASANIQYIRYACTTSLYTCACKTIT